MAAEMARAVMAWILRTPPQGRPIPGWPAAQPPGRAGRATPGRGPAPAHAVCCLLACALLASACVPRSEAPLPDVVLVVLDTVRRDSVRVGGRGDNATPHLDALSRDAVVFDRAYSTHDSTPPSHFSLFTGFTRGMGGPLDHPENTLAGQLRRVGYRSIGVSANGNVSPRTLRVAAGFDAFVNLMDRYDDATPAERAERDAEHASLLERFGAQPSAFNRRILASDAPAVIEQLDAVLGPDDAPRFVFVNVIDAHDPYFPAALDPASEPPLPGFVSDLRARPLPAAYTDPSLFAKGRRDAFLEMKRNVYGGVWRVAWDLSGAELARYHARYLAEVRQLDASLAPLWEVLERHGLLDGILVVTADHGECFGERGYVTHSFRDQGDPECSTHVPLFIRTPGAPPRRVTRRVSIADVPPTIYDLVGIDDAPLRRLGRTAGGYGRSMREDLGLPARAVRLVAKPELRRHGRDGVDARARARLRSLGYIE